MGDGNNGFRFMVSGSQPAPEDFNPGVQRLDKSGKNSFAADRRRQTQTGKN
jgi:hypothetical protein